VLVTRVDVNVVDDDINIMAREPSSKCRTGAGTGTDGAVGSCCEPRAFFCCCCFWG
jgi:hypothetical protein